MAAAAESASAQEFQRIMEGFFPGYDPSELASMAMPELGKVAYHEVNQAETPEDGVSLLIHALHFVLVAGIQALPAEICEHNWTKDHDEFVRRLEKIHVILDAELNWLEARRAALKRKVVPFKRRGPA
jgi:hypothetical protein